MVASSDGYVEINGSSNENADVGTPPQSARNIIQTIMMASSSPSNNSNAGAKKKLLQASVICGVFMVIEVVAGLFSNSLALITDASHLLSDLSSFLISLFALWASDLPGTHQLSFGYHRAEILGALISVMLIWVITFFLVIEAFNRLARPQPVNGRIMFFTAFIGTVANLFMTYILGVHSHGIGTAHAHGHEGGGCESHNHNHKEHSHHNHSNHNGRRNNNHHLTHDNTPMHNGVDTETSLKSSSTTTRDASDARDLEDVTTGFTLDGLRQGSFASDLAEPLVIVDDYGKKNVNLRAAYVHALGDLIQNVGVLIASALIWLRPSWSIADPISTFLFSLLVLTTTISILKEATNVLMEGTPSEIDLGGLRDALVELDNVSEVHDLHVWSLSVGKPSLACHIVVDSEEEARRVLRQATYICQKEFGILHTTIQIDFSANKLACDTDAHSKCH